MRIFLKAIFILYLIGLLNTSFLHAEENKDVVNLKKHKILVIQHQDFAPYTNAYKGFIKKLKQSQYWENLTIESYNAKTNISDLDKKIKEISKRDDIDLIFALGTQSAKKVSSKIKNIPIIFTGAASPLEAGIIKDWKSSGSNITGVGTPNQITKSLVQAYSISAFRSIGVTYLSDSPNHEAVVREIKEFCKKNGIKFIHDATPFKQKDGKSYPDEIMQKYIQKSLDYILPQVDVFYVQASATYEKNFFVFRRAFKKYEVPSIGELVFIKKGIVMGVGPNDFIFGSQAADYAVKILFEGAKPSELPIDIGEKFTILMNIEGAKASQMPLSFIMPVLNSADAIYQTIDEF